MPKTLTARGADGLVAIHEPGADLNNPLSNLGNIYFHSALDYLNIVAVVNVNLALPAYGSGAIMNGMTQLHNIYSHGMGRSCLVLGRRKDTQEALTGSSPVSTSSSGANGKIAVGSDATNVYIVFSGNYCWAQTIPLEILVFNNPLF